MNVDESVSCPPPEWMSLVRPGRLDLQILRQETFWVDRGAIVWRLDDMSADHLQAVAGMLRGQATRLHLWALVDAVSEIRASARSGAPSGVLLEFALTGTSIADASARDFVDAPPLLRAIDRRLAVSD